MVAVPRYSHRRPFPISPLLALRRDGTTTGRAPLIRFLPLQRLPVAWPCSGAASLRKPPATALDGQSDGACVSPFARTSPPMRCFAWRDPHSKAGVHPSSGDGCASRCGSCIVAYLVSAMFRYPRLGNPRGLVAGKLSRNSAPGVRPFAVLTRPARVGALPPVSPTCRFMAESLRRYRSEDRPP